MEKCRVEVTVFVLEEVRLEQQIEAREEGVLGQMCFLGKEAEFLWKPNRFMFVWLAKCLRYDAYCWK